MANRKMFTFEPFVGPLPLHFGMTPKEVATLIGEPDRLLPDAFGNRSELRPNVSLGYDSHSTRLCEAVFASGELYFHETDLFAVENPIEFLRQFDPAPQAAVGMVFFVSLGLRLSGFHDGDISQRAIGLTTKGHWDEYLDLFVPFQ